MSDKVAIFPAREILSFRELSVAFNGKISPQLRVWLSNKKGFPRPVERRYSAAAVIAWARENGWQVTVA